MDSKYLEHFFNGTSRICGMQIVFVDIVSYSRRKSQHQVTVIDSFTKLLESALAETSKRYIGYSQNKDINLRKDIVILPTGDGAAVGFPFPELEDIHLFFARELLCGIVAKNTANKCAFFEENSWCNCHDSFDVRIGISDGRVILYKDLNNNYNMAGYAINMASRVMNCADRNQILLTEEAFEQLDEFSTKIDVGKTFRRYDDVIIKHNVKISLFQYIDPEVAGLNCSHISNLDPKAEDEEISARASAITEADAVTTSDFAQLIAPVKSSHPSLYSELVDHFVPIPPGIFNSHRNGQDVQIRISRTFYLGRFPVTQHFYEQVMGTMPAHFEGPTRPVENVTWFDAMQFCNQLSHLCGLDVVYEIDRRKVHIQYSKRGFRLPTEAEWEYACRANGSGLPGDVSEVAWNGKNADRQTHPVGQKAPNGFGLYDMFGNVWEWCNDWFEKSYPQISSELLDPVGPADGFERVLRGGSWANPPASFNHKTRHREPPSSKDNNRGFRLVLAAQV